MQFLMIMGGAIALMLCGYIGTVQNDHFAGHSKAQSKMLAWLFGIAGVLLAFVMPVATLVCLYAAGAMWGIAEQARGGT